jgi:ribonuclease HI
MTMSTSQQVRCPCCGEVFALADAQRVEPEKQKAATPVASSSPATTLPIQLVFDGGSRGNPGEGYGSYQLTVRSKAETPQRLRFGDEYTSNEAEYDTLIEALEAVLRRAKDPKRIELEIRGDSQLVINQINGTWKTKEPRMQERKEHVLALLQRVGSWRASWHRRDNSVKAFGH